MGWLSGVERVLLIAPHADDDVLGCGGLLAVLQAQGVRPHVVFMAVEGSFHHGHPHATTFPERIAEIEAVSEFLGFSWEILFPDAGKMEKLDQVPKRTLVDRFQDLYREYRPQLLLLPYHVDYDQDHRQTFETAFAAARPIAEVFGGWLTPMILAYEQSKLSFAWQDLPRPQVFVDISKYIDIKCRAIELYRTQFRPPPHVRSLEAVRALARLRGAEIGTDFAEAYKVERLVLT